MTSTYPDILDQFVPARAPTPPPSDAIICADVGGNRVFSGDTFQPIIDRSRRGPLIIYGKRWYFRLVPKKAHEISRARALMDDYNLNNIARHLVICATPGMSPEDERPLMDREGQPLRIYAFFDSYLDFYDYMIKFPHHLRCFYEIIFGELPQKPHFDIDVSAHEVQVLYPGEDFETVASTVRETVISGCIEVLSEHMIMLDLSSDLLMYSSHGPDKQSYHLVLHGVCHDTNAEAKAFYNAVVAKVSARTHGKYVKFIDNSVYSPRQQFRIMGSQKLNSKRPKVFHEVFRYAGAEYTHKYSEDVSDVNIKKLTLLHESLVSFTSGCKSLPSLVPEKALGYGTYDNSTQTIDDATVEYCMKLLDDKMTHHPFSIRGVGGNRIDLKRHAPSMCPLCESAIPHEKENPYMLVRNNKVYWHCRRADSKIGYFLGYYAMTFDEIQRGHTLPAIAEYNSDEDDDGNGVFMFGTYDIGQPTLEPQVRAVNTSQVIPQSQDRVLSKHNVIPDTQAPGLTPAHAKILSAARALPETQLQNVADATLKMTRDLGRAQEAKRNPEHLSLKSAITSVPWAAGLK